MTLKVIVDIINVKCSDTHVAGASIATILTLAVWYWTRVDVYVWLTGFSVDVIATPVAILVDGEKGREGEGGREG